MSSPTDSHSTLRSATERGFRIDAVESVMPGFLKIRVFLGMSEPNVSYLQT